MAYSKEIETVIQRMASDRRAFEQKLYDSKQEKPRLFIKQDSQVTTFKVRGNPFRFVVMTNSQIAKYGASNAIRQRAARALQMGFHNTARHQNAIADILDGVAQ